MAYGTGLDAQIGFGTESTWGTAVTPTRFLPLTSEGIKANYRRIASRGLRAGTNPMPLSSTYRNTWNDAAGPVTIDIFNQGMGIILKSMLGSAASTNSGAAYTWTHTMGTTLPSATVQLGRSSTNGDVNKFTYAGGKVTDWTITLEDNALAQLTTTWDFKSETSATSGVTSASYASGLETFSFTDANVLQLDGSDVAAVRKITINGKNPMANELVYLGNSGQKAEQKINDWRSVTGTLECDFTSKAALYDSYTSKTELTLDFKLTSSTTIGVTGTAFSFRVQIPALYLTGETPNVNGPDILSMTMPFETYYDGTNSPVTITQVTSDTTL